MKGRRLSNKKSGEIEIMFKAKPPLKEPKEISRGKSASPPKRKIAKMNTEAIFCMSYISKNLCRG